MRHPEVTVLPKAIAAWRATRSLTQKQLAELTAASGAKCSLATIGMIESGERQPTLDLANGIAAVLHVELETIAVPHDSKLAQRIAVAVSK